MKIALIAHPRGGTTRIAGIGYGARRVRGPYDHWCYNNPITNKGASKQRNDSERAIQPSQRDAFREAGFKTAWFSNQNKLSGVDTPLYAIAKEADFVYFTNGDYNKNTRFDDELLAPLNDYLRNTKAARNLIIIHTMGSHEVYRQRYPQEFARFQPASTGDDYNFASAGIRERLLNSYDNSILYTDFILSRLIALVEEQLPRSLVVYFSDHGENILDDQNRRFGHGGVVPTRYVTEIPMLFWTSKSLDAWKPELRKHLRENTDKLVSTLCLFDTLTETADVQLPQSKTGCNLAAPLTREYDWLVLGASYNPLRYRDIPPAQLADEPEAIKGKMAARGRVLGKDGVRVEEKL